MLRASELYGRSVVDLDSADRVGEVDEIIVDPFRPGVAGYVVSCDRSLFGQRKRIIIPIEAVHAIGPDAVTIRGIDRPGDHVAHLDALPRLAELTGRRMISYGGRLLGSVEDALIDERDGRIVGYPLARGGPRSWLDSVFGPGWRLDQPEYVRADGGLRIGNRLIVVPDSAITTADDLNECATPSVASPANDILPGDDVPGPDEIQQAGATTSPFSLHAILHEDPPIERDVIAEQTEVGRGPVGVSRPPEDADEEACEVVGLSTRPTESGDEVIGLATGPTTPDDDTVVLSPAPPRRGRAPRRSHGERVR
jgi:sporulation protein YlmC with PRC-barrel domain